MPQDTRTVRFRTGDSQSVLTEEEGAQQLQQLVPLFAVCNVLSLLHFNYYSTQFALRSIGKSVRLAILVETCTSHVVENWQLGR